MLRRPCFFRSVGVSGTWLVEVRIARAEVLWAAELLSPLSQLTYLPDFELVKPPQPRGPPHLHPTHLNILPVSTLPLPNGLSHIHSITLYPIIVRGSFVQRLTATSCDLIHPSLSTPYIVRYLLSDSYHFPSLPFFVPWQFTWIGLHFYPQLSTKSLGPCVRLSPVSSFCCLIVPITNRAPLVLKGIFRNRAPLSPLVCLRHFSSESFGVPTRSVRSRPLS